MITIISENFIKFTVHSDRRISEVIAEIETDTVSEFPVAESGKVLFRDRLLHQGTVIHAIKDGVIAMLSSDGNWYSPTGEIVNISG